MKNFVLGRLRNSAMNQNNGMAGSPNGQGPLLSILPGGPTAAQIGAGTLTDSKGNAVTWTRTTAGYVDTGAAQDPAQLLTNPEHLGVGSAWTNPSGLVTITEGYAADPGGFPTATRIQQPANASRFTSLVKQGRPQAMSPTGSWSTQTVTFTAYVMATNGVSATFAMGITWAGVADYYTPDLVANGTWQRFTFTKVFPTNASTGDTLFGFALPSTLAATDIVVAGLKAEISASATPYNFTGQNNQVIRSIAANKPRVGPLGVLVESAATNLCLQSQALANVAWTATAATATDNAAIAPDGTLTADSVAWTATTNGLQSTGTTAAASLYTASIYVRAPSGTPNVTLVIRDTTASSDLATTTVATSSAWQRVSVALSANATAGNALALVLRGTNGTTVQAWGAQTEADLFPSSYIATTTVAVARGADVGSIANPLTDQTSFSMGAKASPYVSYAGSSFKGVLSLGHWVTANTAALYINGSSQLVFDCVDSASDERFTTSNTVVSAATHTVAGSRSAGTLKTQMDGTVYTGDGGGTLGATTAATTFYLGALGGGTNSWLNGYLSDIYVSKTPF